MSLVQNNPFNKPNPFKQIQFDRFQHPHLANKSANDYSHLVYHDSHKLQHLGVLNNNWTFNDNNLGKKVDFSRKVDLNNSQISQFQMRMKSSSVYAYPSNQSKAPEVRDGKLQNPFHRKNLIVDKQTIINQIEVDLSVYRARGNTSYQQRGSSSHEQSVTKTYDQNVRVSFGTVMTQESPPLRSKQQRQSDQRKQQRYLQVTKVPEIQVDSPNPLTYSKTQTPDLTPRQSNREKQPIAPKTLQFRKKTFFLNTSNDI